MHKIDKFPWGYKLTFSGSIDEKEMAGWVKDSEKSLLGHSAEFGVFVDMRDLKPLADATQKEMQKGQEMYKKAGMKRSAVILNSSMLTLQFKRLAKETGIYQWERYINATDANWEAKAMDWIVKGTDPDK